MDAETNEFSVSTDEHGERLTGARQYVWRFEPQDPPAARPTWSIAIRGDATEPQGAPTDGASPGLVRGEDGSLMIWLWHGEPHDPDKRANWLPTPLAPFEVVLRIDGPLVSPSVESWPPPPVRIVEP